MVIRRINLVAYRDRTQRDFRLTTNSNAEQPTVDFSKIRVGKEKLNGDIHTLIDKYYSSNRTIGREQVEHAIERHDIKEMRRISNHFFETSGIYSRLCRYMAYLYRYD